MRSLLLIGKNGQVGAELSRLLPQFANVTALNRQQLDLSKPEDLRRTVRDIRPQIIVNAAAYTAVDKAESESALAYAINADAPAILAEAARSIGAVVVHYSTDYIFDGQKKTPYVESDSTNPLSVYGKSKLAGETAIRESGALHLVFRIAWVYATRGQNFLLSVLRLASQRKELRMVSDQVGTPNRARDIAQATCAVLRQLCAASDLALSFERVSGVYHLSANGATTRYDFAQAIFDEFRGTATVPAWASAVTEGRSLLLERLLPITSAQFPTPATRPLYSVLSSDRFSRTFGISSPDWRRQLHETFVNSEA